MIELAPGTAVDRYTVVAPIGQGGMASVYHVRHQRLGSDHVLKLLLTPSPKVRERLLLEGQVQARLKHRNVVEVTDVVDLQGAPGLVMELVRGPALDEVLADHRVPLEEAEQLVPGMLAGVAAAHHEGVVHRDLKPANVLLSLDRGKVVPKVADFGLVKLTAEEGGRAKTRTGAAMGTPQYMAPEQIQSAKDVDERADIWALGTILYELVRGQRAFEGDTHYAIFEKVVRAEMEPLPDDTPPRMRRAIEAALQIDPAERPQTVEDLWLLWSDGETPLETAAHASVHWPEDRVKRCAELAPSLSASTSLASAGSLEPITSNPTFTDEVMEASAETYLPPESPAPAAVRTRDAPTSSGTWVKVAAGGAAGGIVLAIVAGLSVVLTLGAVLVLLADDPEATDPPKPTHEVAPPPPQPTPDPDPEPEPEPRPEPAPQQDPAPVAEPAAPVPSPEPTAPVPSAEPKPKPEPEVTGTATFETTGGVPVLLVADGRKHGPGQVPAGTYTVTATFETGRQSFGTVTLKPGDSVLVRCAPALSNCSF